MKTSFRMLLIFLTLGVLVFAATAPPASARQVDTQTALTARLSAAVPVSGLPIWPVLRRGTNTAWPVATVRALQRLLNAHGAFLVVDGIFGARTAAAVRTHQQANGLAADGVVGPRTWSSLIITVRRGSVGRAVTAVQDLANARGPNMSGPPLVLDGTFGPKTDAWVRAFQAAITGHVTGFYEDGIVGPLTWSLLLTGEKPQELYCS